MSPVRIFVQAHSHVYNNIIVYTVQKEFSRQETTLFLYPPYRTFIQEDTTMKYRVGILGATGIVGQRLTALLSDHPWFSLSAVAASEKSAGNLYADTIKNRWIVDTPVPEGAKGLTVLDSVKDSEKIAKEVDFVFCALNMDNAALRLLEETYARMECPVISNNSAHRWTEDVPMIIPEINPDHSAIIPHQRQRLGTQRGFIAVKSNCSLQSYVPALHPLREFGLESVLVCTYQAISGAGRTFADWPEMLDNCIPYIAGEEEKSENEPLKLWGTLAHGRIKNASSPSITSQCIRVPCSDGHLAACFMRFKNGCTPPQEDIIRIWDSFSSIPHHLDLPSAPAKFIHYFRENDRPQTRLDRMAENGMGISIGRLRPDTQYDYKFISLSHNTIRGAAGGAILLAELLCKQGYL